MSNPVALLVQVGIGFVASKVASEVFDNEMLGAIVGIAAGGWAGGMMNPGATATTGTAVAEASPVAAGSTMGGSAGTLGMGTPGWQEFGLLPQQSAMPATSGIPGVPGSSVPGERVSAPKSAGLLDKAVSGLGNVSADKWMELGSGLLSGYGKGERDQEYMDLLLRKQQEEEDTRGEQSAFGMTRDGRKVPLIVAEQLAAVNERTKGAMGNFTNIQNLQRPEDQGYASTYGRYTNKRGQNQ